MGEAGTDRLPVRRPTQTSTVPSTPVVMIRRERGREEERKGEEGVIPGV